MLNCLMGPPDCRSLADVLPIPTLGRAWLQTLRRWEAQRRSDDGGTMAASMAFLAVNRDGKADRGVSSPVRGPCWV